MNGWHALGVLRWLIVLTAIVGLAIWFFQTTRGAPALPVTATAVGAIPACGLLIGLIWRVLLDAPGSRKAGAYIGLALSAAIAIGIYWSLRTDAPAN